MTQKTNLFEFNNLLLLFFGAISGGAFALNVLSVIFHHGINTVKLAGGLCAGIVLFILLFFLARKIILWLLSLSSLPEEVKNKFSKYHPFTYSVFLLLCLGAFGIKLELLPII